MQEILRQLIPGVPHPVHVSIIILKQAGLMLQEHLEQLQIGALKIILPVQPLKPAGKQGC
jgi:hypothetical protein